jgi:hypothetical protein
MGANVVFPDGAIHITGRNNETINFTVSQLWKQSSDIGMFGVHYHDGIGSTDCDKYLDVAYSFKMNYTAICIDGFADIGIFLYLGEGTDFNPDECDACAMPNDNATDLVGYYIELNCNPVLCPSESPSAVPTQSPTDICLADVMKLAQTGFSTYKGPPIKIISQNITTVTFSVHQKWVEGSISYLYTQFHIAPTGDTECFENQNVLKDQFFTYTAYCMHNVPITIVDVWVSDSSLNKSLDDAEVPNCCHPPGESVIPAVQYTFELKCVSECVPTSGPIAF